MTKKRKKAAAPGPPEPDPSGSTRVTPADKATWRKVMDHIPAGFYYKCSRCGYWGSISRHNEAVSFQVDTDGWSVSADSCKGCQLRG